VRPSCVSVGGEEADLNAFLSRLDIINSLNLLN
jgi:hypothetical protein